MQTPDVYKILADAAAQWPGNPAVYDEHGMISFKQLFSETEALRLRLLESGISKGMGVGVKAQNGRNFIIGIFAAAGCGAAVMPMSHQLKKAEIDIILEEAKLHAILDDGSGSQPLVQMEVEIPMRFNSFRLPPPA